MAFRVFMLFLIVSVLGVGLYDYLGNFEDNGCEMTYMFVMPQYLKVDLNADIKVKFPRYGLYFYGEGEYAESAKKSDFRMSGVPVLFIPGNAGSHKQVRSLGSVAQKKAEDSKSKFQFNYFSLDFDEELSGVYGQALYDQAEFTHLCIKKILGLYKGAASPPKSVILVGHSMGGMIARSLFTLPGFKPALVTTIITQATPHQAPAVSGEPVLAQFYQDVNTYWRQHENDTVSDVTVLSTGGGYRDVLVRSHLTSLNGIVRKDRSVSSNTMSVPGAWVSTDHLCHVWCKQMVLVTKRAMFDIIDQSTKQVAVSHFYRVAVFMHHFYKNAGIKKFKGAYDKTVALDKNIKWEIRKKLSWRLWTDAVSKLRYSVTEIPPLYVPAEYAEAEYGYVAISNMPRLNWLGICSLREKSDPSKPINVQKKKKKTKLPEQCLQVDNHAPYADQLPPLYSNKKVVHISPETVKENTHIVTILPKTKKRVELYSELYKVSERHISYNTTGLLSFFKRFPRSVLDLDVIINKTAPLAVFYNISLNDLDIPLQAYTAHLTTLVCTESPPATSSGAVMKLHTPWVHEDTYTFIKSNESGSIPLKLMTARPINLINQAQLHLYLLPTCTYKLSVTIAWSQLPGQFLRFYAPYIVGFMVIQVLMVLSWQMKSLDEQGNAPDFTTSHARWAQPWRVVPLGLLVRFMLYYPEDDNMASKLGIPHDDRMYLERHGEWYAALPIMMYLSSYAIMGLQAIFIHLVLASLGRVFGSIITRLQGDSRLGRLLYMSQYVFYIAGLLLSMLICGSLGILIVYFITIIKTVSLYVSARRQSHLPVARWSAYHIHTSLLMISLLALMLNVPALLAWTKNISYSLQLEMDPSKTIGTIMCITAIMLTIVEFPVNTGEMYGIAAALLYITCVVMVLFTTVSVHRISTFIYAALIIITSAATFSYGLERPAAIEPTAETEKSKTE